MLIEDQPQEYQKLDKNKFEELAKEIIEKKKGIIKE